MFSSLIHYALSNLLYFALRIENNGSFPKPLPAAKERECFEKMAAGDQNARNTLIEHNLRLVAHIIKKYYATTNDQEDLISIGTIGLIKAVGAFNYEKGAKFATYASRCIENEILMYFRGIKKTAGDVYINDTIDNDKDGNPLMLIDVISDENCLIDGIDLKLKVEQLKKHIAASLDPREQKIIRMRYGLCGFAPLTQRETAKKLDISRSYVSRIEKKALEKLRITFRNS
ncbi:MAG: RNA polymerase sporulation sigma factor SigK [Oscillospiraceae bacterium]|nr:RNA polymerase sporulation sigma factor SigK [Oscillospiraceae bacterium]